LGVDVRGQEFHVPRGGARFQERDGDGVDLLAGGAARRPDGQPAVLVPRLREEAGQERGQGAELTGIAKKGGLSDGDQGQEALEFFLFLLEQSKVAADVPIGLLAHPVDQRRPQKVVALRAHLEADALPKEARHQGDVLVRDLHHRTASRMASAMAPSGRTRSAAPSSIAARGMPKTAEVASSWAMVIPPRRRISRSPSEPSVPMPVSRTPIARAP